MGRQLGSVTVQSAQHSVQPTSGSLRVLWQFSTPRQDSVFEPAPRPAHLRLTHSVRSKNRQPLVVCFYFSSRPFGFRDG
jgi:hypothetical protein